MHIATVKMAARSAGRLAAMHPADPLTLNGRCLALQAAPLALCSASRRSVALCMGLTAIFVETPVPPPVGDWPDNRLTAFVGACPAHRHLQ
jgi:hypothetical protein